MKTITPDEINKKDLHHLMLGTVIPRPIALVSTIDENGIKNLAPFSYFNAISSNPPMLAFSVNLKHDGTKKDTLLNIEKTGVCVVNMVSSDMAFQMSLCGSVYDKNIDEYKKSGLTPVKNTTIEGFGVAESPVRFECKLNKIISFGTHPGASNLIICDVTCIHIDEKIYDDNNKINPAKTGILGRLGRAYYLKINKENIFKIAHAKNPTGFDNLPPNILNSPVLSKNEIAQIAALPILPSREELKEFKDILQTVDEYKLHKIAAAYLKQNEVYEAAKFLMIPVYFL